MRSSLKLSLACAGCLAAANPIACGSSPPQGFATGDGGSGSGSGGSSGGSSGGGSSGGVAGDSGSLFLDGASGDDGSSNADCRGGAAKFIYVVSDQNELYTFDPTLVPATTAFKDLGPLNCPGEPTPPPDNGGVNSMAVDRQAFAWVNFNDGKIFKVDTTVKNLPCTATSFTGGSGGFTPQLGMGFATTSATDKTETLYVSDNGGPGGACTSTTPGPGCTGLGLGSIAQSTMTLAAIGPYTGASAGYNAELSGTGDGLLYGFFTTTPSQLG